MDLGAFIVGLVALALVLERIVEKLFSWIPEVLKKTNAVRSSRLYRENVGSILTIFVLLFGWMIAYYGNLLVLKELFSMDVSRTLDSFTTALFIVGGADVFHQIIRFIEEKKEKTKEERRFMKLKWYKRRTTARAKSRSMSPGFARKQFR